MTLLSSTSNNSLRTFECNYENPAFPTKTGSYGISKSWNRRWQQIPRLKKGFLPAIERQHSWQPRFIVITCEIVPSRKISQSGIVFAFPIVAVLRAIPNSKQRTSNNESKSEATKNMLRGLYSGATAMNALAKQQELISSNLANINSNGFRRAVLSFEELRVGTTDKQIGVSANKPSIDFSTGTPQQTGNPLDVSISGDGFFSVQTPDGTRYTRAGSFHRDPNSGQLVNVEGFPVDGDGGPINIDPSISDREISLDTTGIFSARGLSLGTLAVTKFADNNQLIPHGQVYFEAPAGAASEVSPGEIIQGSLEMSNSQPVTELINLIITSRMFEAAERSMRTISETIQQHYRA